MLQHAARSCNIHASISQTRTTWIPKDSLCCARRAAAMLIPSSAIAAGMIPDDRWMRTPNIPTSNQLKNEKKKQSLCQTQPAQKSKAQTANSTSPWHMLYSLQFKVLRWPLMETVQPKYHTVPRAGRSQKHRQYHSHHNLNVVLWYCMCDFIGQS